jgi:MFS family permease
MSGFREAVLLLAVTALALGLRLVDLGGESIWLDEAFSMDMAARPADELIQGKPLDPGNPPVYYVVLGWWLDLFGSTVEAGRAFSGVLGALAAPATWLLARSAGGASATRLVSALLVATSPALIYLGREVRVYALFTLVVTLAAAVAETIVHSPSPTWRRLGVWGLFTALAASFSYLHYYSFLLLAVFGVYLGLRLLPRGPGEVLAVVTSFALVALAFLPWLPMFKDQMALGTTRGEGTWYLHLAAMPLYSIAGHTLVWRQHGAGWMAGVTAIAVVCIYLPILLWGRRSKFLFRLPMVLAVGLVLVATLISVAKSPMIHSRYLSVILPGLLTVLAAGLVEGWRERGLGIKLATAGLIGVVTASLALLYTERHKEDWRPIAGFIAKEGPSLPVFCYEDVAKLSFSYYAPWMNVTSIDPVAMRFTPTGQKWEEKDLPAEMTANPLGSWFILYLSLPTTMPELEEIDGWLRGRFRVSMELGQDVKNPRFPFIHVYRISPKS